MRKRALWVVVVGAAACVERALPLPESADNADLAVTLDLAADAGTIPDLTAPDLAAVDLAERDLSLVDLGRRDASDLATRDLATDLALHDLAMDLAPPDLAMDLAVPPIDLSLPDGFDGDAGLLVFGNPNAFATTGTFLSGYLLGQALDLPRLTVLRIGVVVLGTCNQGRWALYTDVGGHPGTLALAVGPVTVSTGRNEITAPPNLLPAGRYWLTGDYDVNCGVGIDRTVPRNTSTDYRGIALGVPLPDSFGSADEYAENQYNYYLVGVAQ